MRILNKIHFIYAIFLLCLTVNLLATETSTEKRDREQREAIDRHKNDRTIHGKVRSSLPDAKSFGDAFLAKWQRQAEWAKEVRQNKLEYQERLKRNAAQLARENEEKDRERVQKEAAAKYESLTRSCTSYGRNVACLCEKNINQIRNLCSNDTVENSDAVCGILDEKFSDNNFWPNIQQKCRYENKSNSTKKELNSKRENLRLAVLSCIEGEHNSCLSAPNKLDSLKRMDPTASADNTIIAMQYACYRSSKHCKTAEEIELKYGQTFSAKKRHLRIKKMILTDKCRLKPELNTCLEAGQLVKKYDKGESSISLSLLDQACDLVDRNLRSVHPACTELGTLDIKYCSGNADATSKKLKKHCDNIFDIVKNPKTIKKASYFLIKNCINRQYKPKHREDVCVRAVQRTNHPLAIVEACTIYKWIGGTRHKEYCPLMKKLAAQYDEVAQMVCVAGVHDGKFDANDKKVCKRELNNALTKNQSLRFFYTLSDGASSNLNVGARKELFSELAFDKAKKATNIAEQEFWRRIGCEKSYNHDFCNSKDTNTDRFKAFGKIRKSIIKTSSQNYPYEKFDGFPDLRYLNTTNSSSQFGSVFSFKNGDSYDGIWKDGRPNGIGIYTFSNGDIYYGQFKMGEIYGKIMHFSFKNGYIFDGEYKGSLRHGRGTLTAQDGASITGNWQNGYLEGKATLTTTDLNTVEKEYKHGKIVYNKNAKLEGIGIAFKFDKKTKQYYIIALGNNMPAKIAGVKIGDIIISANDEKLIGISSAEAVNKIKGPSGTIVKLELKRNNKTITLPVMRGKIDLNTLRKSL